MPSKYRSLVLDARFVFRVHALERKLLRESCARFDTDEALVDREAWSGLYEVVPLLFLVIPLLYVSWCRRMPGVEKDRNRAVVVQDDGDRLVGS